MAGLTALQVIAAINILILVVVAFIPAVMFTVGTWSLHEEIFDYPMPARPGSDDPEYEERFRQFEALGFRAVGVTRKTGWFVSPLTWLWRCESRWMMSPDATMLVSLTRHRRRQPLQLAVMTLNDGGGLLRSSTLAHRVAIKPTRNYARFEIPGADPARLIATHRDCINAFHRERGLTAILATFTEAAAADVALDRLAIKGTVRGGVHSGYREAVDPMLSRLSWPWIMVTNLLGIWDGSVPKRLMGPFLILMAALVVAGVFFATFAVRSARRR